MHTVAAPCAHFDLELARSGRQFHIPADGTSVQARRGARIELSPPAKQKSVLPAGPQCSFSGAL